MPYVYRYIDLTKREVVYIGKVTGEKSIWVDPLLIRHKQHKREKWYKEIQDENVVMQFVEVDSNADADIFETWLISHYDTGQLVNKAKTGWGMSTIDLSDCVFGKWRTFIDERDAENELESMARILYKQTEGLTIKLEDAIKHLNTDIRSLAKQKQKAHMLSSLDEQGDFIRREAEDNTIDRLESNA